MKRAIDLVAKTTAAASGSLPPALVTFPTLQKWTKIRPRRLAKVPVGFKKARIDAYNAQSSLSTLYHDLGVLIFAGCNHEQTQRIGNVLRSVASSGGIGKLFVQLRCPATIPQTYEVGHINRGHFQTPVDSLRTGLLTPDILIKLGREHLTHLISTDETRVPLPAGAARSTIESQVLVPGSPPPRATVHYGLTGARNLALRSYAYIGCENRHGRLQGEVLFFTVGKEDYVGSVEMSFMVMLKMKDDIVARAEWANRLVEANFKNDESFQQNVLQVLHKTVFKPLWELETEIWEAKWGEAQKQKVEDDKARERRREEKQERIDEAASERWELLGGRNMAKSARRVLMDKHTGRRWSKFIPHKPKLHRLRGPNSGF